MKRFYLVFITILIMSLLVSCSIPSKQPDSGIWYCKELNLYLEFLEDKNITATLATSDGEYENLVCEVDHIGGSIFLEPPGVTEVDNEEYNDHYFSGDFYYIKDKFIVKSYSNHKFYKFTLISDEDPYYQMVSNDKNELSNTYKK